MKALAIKAGKKRRTHPKEGTSLRPRTIGAGKWRCLEVGESLAYYLEREAEGGAHEGACSRAPFLSKNNKKECPIRPSFLRQGIMASKKNQGKARATNSKGLYGPTRIHGPNPTHTTITTRSTGQFLLVLV